MFLGGGNDQGQSAKPRASTGPALEAMYRFLLWLVPTVEKFPRSQKFLLGDRIQSTALDVLERLIEATYTRNGAPLLARRQPRAGEAAAFCSGSPPICKLLDLRRYEHAARSIDEIGRLVGGWLKASRCRRTA